MNNSLILCVVISWVIFALSSAAEDEVDKWHSEELKILSKKLEDWEQRIHSLEEDQDQRIHSLEDQVTTLSSRLNEKEETVRNLAERLAAVEIDTWKMNESQDKKEDAETKMEIKSVTSTGFGNQTLEERVEKLEDLAKVQTLRSCQEYYDNGITTSGYYSVDPDGTLIGDVSFVVYCKFNYDGKQAVTEILHDKDFMLEIEHCPSPFCFQLDVTYSGSIGQISTLKDISDTCYQQITFDCFLSPLDVNGDPVGVWLDKDGNEQVYFDGNNEGLHTCSCGAYNNCSDTEHGLLCNCDAAQIPLVQEDSGVITNVDALPITGFRYGDLKYQTQFASVHIGKLLCEGKKTVKPENLMDSCVNLKLDGVTQSGNFILNDQSVSYCEMTKKITDPDIQRHVGRIQYREEDVAFIVTATENSGCIPTGVITFDNKIIDYSNSFNIKEGIFVVPVTGNYLFFFNSPVGITDFSGVYVHVNGYDDYFFEEATLTDDSSYLLNFMFTMQLEEGLELWLENPSSDTLFNNLNYPMTFVGYKTY